MRSKTWTILAIAMLATVVGCAPGAAPAQPGQPSAGQPPAAIQRLLVAGIRQEPPTLAARAIVAFTPALYTQNYLFNASIDYRDERDVLHPQLVEALPQVNTDTWKVNSDGTMDTKYTLKPNLTWQDGTPLTAEDFVFGWKVYATKDFGAAGSPPISLMENMTAPDPRTVVIHWKQIYPDAAGFQQTANYPTYQPFPRHLLEQHLKDLDPVAFTALPFWTSEYVGAGPYRVEKWEPGAYIQARAFDGYVLGKPKIERIELRFIPDPQTAVANLLAGEVHFVSDFVLTVTDGQTLEQQWPSHGGGTVLYSPISLRNSVVQLRPQYMEAPALQDARVRQAIAFGYDAQTAVDVLTAGKGLPTNTLTSPRVPYYGEIEKVIQKYQYDPRRVQQLMESAGFTKASDGFYAGADGKSLTFSIASSSGAKNESEVAAYVDGQRKAGINATQKVIPAAQIDDPEVRATVPGIQVRGGGILPVTYTSEQVPTAENRWRGDNRAGWSSPEYDRLFGSFTSTLAENDRVQLLAQMEKLLTEQLPVIPHFFGVESNPVSDQLKGPIARQTPNSASAFINVHEWNWVK